jgi:hypothetical protein
VTLPNEGRTSSGLFSFRVAPPADADLLPRIARARADGRRHVWLRAMDTATKPLERYAALGFRLTRK